MVALAAGWRHREVGQVLEQADARADRAACIYPPHYANEAVEAPLEEVKRIIGRRS